MPRIIAIALLAVGSGAVLAADPAPLPAELDALELADQAPAKVVAPASPWRAYVELTAGQDRLGSGREGWGRASFDLRWDGLLAPGLRAVLSDRLDITRGDGPARDDELNTLREAYLDWAVSDGLNLEAGRVNVRQGVALGYNPTDAFKDAALRSVTTADPLALRENRQGSFVLRAQQVWPRGSLSLTLSPKLARDPESGTFSLNEGATNPRNRWMLAGTVELGAGLAPQFVLQGGEGQSVQTGLNLSALLGDATVAYAEWSGGKGLPLTAQVQAGPAVPAHQNRAAAGLTYTTPFKLSLTAEAQYNGAAPNLEDWQALMRADPPGAATLLGQAQRQQDLPARSAWFLHASWRDLALPKLDLSAFWRHENTTSSNIRWMELRYRWANSDLALQWLGHGGGSGSLFGSLPLERSVQLAWRLYLP